MSSTLNCPLNRKYKVVESGLTGAQDTLNYRSQRKITNRLETLINDNSFSYECYKSSFI